MTVNNVSTQEQFTKRLECGDFEILETLHKSEDYQFYKVQYISPALRISTILVAVFL